MKKLLPTLLALLLFCLALPCASAADVTPSPQKLSVDGTDADCDKYNIDGSNYFKLRDLAYLLSKSDSRFSVAFDAESNAVTVVPGGDYVPVGGELERGKDLSKTAVASKQSVLINGEAVEGISVYNIGGNNYFKLRDLGDALGFTVDYDADSNTAIVLSKGSTAVYQNAFEKLLENVNEKRRADMAREVTFDGFEDYIVNDPSTIDLLSDDEIKALVTNHPTRQSVSRDDALADVDLLFRALHNAYAAYYYFGEDKFDAAEAEVKAWVQKQKTVNVDKLGQTINTALQFVQDAHFSIRPGEENVKQQKAWYSYIGTEQSFSKDDSGYYRMIDGEKWYVDSLSNKSSEMSPVLRANGSLGYAPTLLCHGKAGSSDTITLRNGDGVTRTDKIVWKANESLLDDTWDRSSACYRYLEENGILYLSIRLFDSRRFADTVLPEYAASGSKAKNCKLVIYDLRSNGGGDDRYARTWTQNFTGAKSVDPKVAAGNRGSKLGNAAGFNWMSVGIFDGGVSRGNWLPNDIPIIVLMDSRCGSSGESALTFAKTMDNVIVIGSNSAGYQLCGNVYDYSLPRTGITACFGVSISLYGSMDNVDYKGYEPDLWCNPKTALQSVLNMVERYDLGSAEGVAALRAQLPEILK
ncbi:MAG: S41 family peptidase [Oscillibacter sp.]|nr:S41 family peptidase [Oscillibacter sp.]